MGSLAAEAIVPDMDISQTINGFNSLVDTLARQMRPANYRYLLAMAAELWIGCPVYQQAITRGVSFFMTDLEVTGTDSDEQKMEEIRDARKLLNQRFAVTDQPTLVLKEAFGFGGACVYLQMPIVRVLSHDCGCTMTVESGMCDHSVTYDVSDGNYKGVCPDCHKQATYTVKDNRVADRAWSAKLRRIPLALCKMNLNPLTGDRELLFDCSKWDMFATGVKNGDPLFHKATPGIFLESARTGQEIRMSDKYFHYVGFEDASIIDMNLQGWGLPPFFYAFNDVVAILLLQKYNQTILSDYIVPFRYVSPPPSVGVARNIGGDHMPFDPSHASTGSFSDYSSKMAQVIGSMRRNPSRIGIFPYPVQFNYMGVDGKQLLSPEMMTYYEDKLMQDLGIPPEFYRGAMGMQVATPSSYNWILFGRYWRPLVSKINEMNQWITDRITESQRWPAMSSKLVPPTLNSDAVTLPILLQRNQSGLLSNETLDRILGVDTDYETRAVAREVKHNEEMMSDETLVSQRKQIVAQMLSDAGPDMQALQQVQMAGQSALPGMPPGMEAGAFSGMGLPAGPAPAMPQPGVSPSPEGSPQAGVTAAEQPALQNVAAKAQQIAQQMIAMYPNVADRAVTLRVLGEQQPQFAMFVEEAIADLENQARKQGLQQARGGGQGM